MTRFLLDTAVFVHASGRPDPNRDPCRNVLNIAAHVDASAHVSVELVQELMHVCSRRGEPRPHVLSRASHVATICELHEFELRDLALALKLFERFLRLDMRDAVHAATAMNRGIDTIVTTDRDFDAIPGLRRVDPADESAVAELVS